MRKIQFKTLTLEIGGNLDYKEQILNLLRFPVNQQGIDINELMKFLSVGKAIKDASDSVLLEEEQWKILSERIKAERWRIIDPAIVEFYNDVIDAPEVKVEEGGGG